ncbi:MAG: hypothetical protein HY234_07320 [Acidobacteria bacterium]|nr:hypothetical protein [Acidobacteriota bacterium]
MTEGKTSHTIPSGSAIWKQIAQEINLCALPGVVNSLSPAEVIPDGSGGLLASWTFGLLTGSQETRITRWSPSGATEYTLPLNGWANPAESLVLGENGTAFATDQSQVLSFDLATGAVRWSWQPAQGPVEMIMATAGNGLVAKNRDETTGLETAVRLDSFGVPTYESWSNPAVQHAVGDLWLGQGSLVGISASEVAWPDSIWPEPDNDGIRGAEPDGIRGAEPKVKLNVFKVAEAGLTDPVITTRVNLGRDFWRKKAGILLDWNGAIAVEPACPSERPQCSVDDDDNILKVSNPAALQEVRRRFSIRQGSYLIFTQSTGSGASGVTLFDSIGPYPQPLRFYNVSVIDSQNLDVVVPHEIGHQFQLQHGPPQPALNLMCGPSGAWGEYLLICTPSADKKLTPDQIQDAKASARAWQ